MKPEASPNRRAAILQAAALLCAERGTLAAASIDDIAARAGVARATLYRYFPNKAAIVTALAAEMGASVPAELPTTRDRILEAARGLVLRQGITGTSLEQIAEAAGIRPPTIYRHFTSKDALLVALIDRLTMLPEVQAGLAQGAAGDPADDLRALALLTMETAADRFALLAVYLAEGPTHPGVAREMLQRSAMPIWSLMAAYLDAQVAADRLRPGPTLPRVYVLVGVMIAFMLTRRLFGAQLPFAPEELVETLVSTFLEGTASPSYRASLDARAAANADDDRGEDDRSGGP